VVEGEPGRPRRVVGADIDITERKRLELELERFAHSAAHDLQEPLRGIRTYSERVLAVNRDQLDPTSFRLMEYVVDSAARMQDLIRAILDYASSGKQDADERAPVDLRKAVDAALIHLRSSIEESGARIDIGDLPVIEGIERDFVRIFQNLIGNGLKYRRETAPVISVSAVCPPGGQWIVSVADNGIGIDPKYHQRIFETFQRVHSRSKYEGTGLGLATCKRIVQQYGGRMWVESEPDKGATFRFTLPEAVAISRKPAQRSEPQPDRAKSLGV
jgi:light-regulated signal transduction histidine kinase (bacteriophytochrome)